MRANRCARWPGLWLALFLVLLGASGHALASAQGVSVSARLSSGVLRLGDAGEVHLTVENADAARVVAVPEVAGLRFGEPRLAGTNQFSTVRGGRFVTEVSLSFRIPFRPEAVGDYEIPPIEVEVGKQRLATKALRLTVAEDLAGADFGYLEVTPSAPFVVEGQPFTVELTFGWDANDKIGFAELNLPWWDTLPGALVLDSAPVPQQSRVEGVEVNGVRIDAEQAPTASRKGREFVTLKIRRTYLPTRASPLEFPTSFFEFGRDRQISIFNTRRESHFVKAEPFTVDVVPLPSEGQPRDFSGAVGKFTMRASADARDVRVGDSIKFAVEWGGQGNLQFFTPPELAALDAFRGFRVFGTTEEKSFERRKVVYDLAPLSTDVKEIPALTLSLYDPLEKRYTSVASAPIPIRVRPLERSGTLADAEKSFERDLADIDAEP
ncbi:MAG: BatD family protein, partial [Planctomycetota bacterium]